MEKNSGDKMMNGKSNVGKFTEVSLAYPTEDLNGVRRGEKESQPLVNLHTEKGPFPFAGILASILGSVFFSFSILFVKFLPDYDDLSERSKIVLCRGILLMFFCSITIVYEKSYFILKREEIAINVLRALLGLAGTYGAYLSIMYISMGDATALMFSSPVWTSLLSYFILKEPLDWILLIALPASLLGIVLIAHPALIIPGIHQVNEMAMITVCDASAFSPTKDSIGIGNQTISILNNSTATVSEQHLLSHCHEELDLSAISEGSYDFEQRWPGVVIALITSLLVSCVYIVLKFNKGTPINTSTFYLGLISAAGSFCVMCAVGFGRWPSSGSEWFLLFLVGSCSWVGQNLLQWALRYESASVLAVVRTLDVAMQFALSALFLNDQILVTSIVGALIIALVVVSIVLNNYIKQRFCSGSNSTRRGSNDDQNNLQLKVGAKQKQLPDDGTRIGAAVAVAAQDDAMRKISAAA